MSRRIILGARIRSPTPTARPSGCGTLTRSANGDPVGAFAYELRFPGQYFDLGTKLHYNVARDYDPRIGRYVESDPIGLAGGLNTYIYVRNNPIQFYDRFGLAGCG